MATAKKAPAKRMAAKIRPIVRFSVSAEMPQGVEWDETYFGTDDLAWVVEKAHAKAVAAWLRELADVVDAL